jgi:hypothetical protein
MRKHRATFLGESPNTKPFTLTDLSVKGFVHLGELTWKNGLKFQIVKVSR